MKKKKKQGGSYTEIEIDALRSMLDKKKKRDAEKNREKEDKKDNKNRN